MPYICIQPFHTLIRVFIIWWYSEKNIHWTSNFQTLNHTTQPSYNIRFFLLPVPQLIKLMILCGLVQIGAYYFVGSMASQYLATVRLTPPKMVREPSDHDDGGKYVQYLRVPRNVNPGQLSQALRDTIGGSNCRHEHDCCGCATRYVRTKLVAPRKLKVTTSVSYNY